MTLPLSNIVDHIHRFIQTHHSCSEHELINYLESEQVEPYGSEELRGVEALFQKHFLTMHALYRLQEKYVLQQTFHLDIELTRITLKEFEAAGSNGLVEHDSVRDYYLDLDNFYNTTAEDVDAMLESFWEKYFAYHHQGDAYAVLDLEVGVTLPEVKQRYRELAQKHHPDRGGDAEKFRKITEAKTALEKVLS